MGGIVFLCIAVVCAPCARARAPVRPVRIMYAAAILFHNSFHCVASIVFMYCARNSFRERYNIHLVPNECLKAVCNKPPAIDQKLSFTVRQSVCPLSVPTLLHALLCVCVCMQIRHGCERTTAPRWNSLLRFSDTF